MWVINLSLMCLIARDIGIVHSFASDSGNLDLARSPSINLSPSLSFGSSPIPLLDVLIRWCHPPEESKGQWRITSFICRHGIETMRKLTNARTTAASDISTKSTNKRTNGQEMRREAEVEAVAMHQRPSSRPPTRPASRPLSRPLNPNAPSFFPPSRMRSGSGSAGSSVPPPFQPPQLEEDFNTRPDGQPEGGYLMTEVRISGENVRALVDTGSEFSGISQKFAGNYIPSDIPAFGASKQAFRLLGKATVNVEVRSGIFIPVTCLVTERKYGLLLGSDFFMSYAAKLNLSKGTMEISIRQTRTKVPMKIKFRDAAEFHMMGSDYYASYTPLQISARLNGIDTMPVIDTGASFTMVDNSFVNQQNLYPVPDTVSFAGSAPVGFMGATDINLLIGSFSLTVRAHVPGFTPSYTLITGNDFNRQYIELINYETKLVTFRFPAYSGWYYSIAVPAIVNPCPIKL